jgi:hypothetical protein
MCLSCIQASRISRIVYGAKDRRLGACGSMVDLVDGIKHPFHSVNVCGGVLADESSVLLKRFFQSRRRENMNEITFADSCSIRAYDYMSTEFNDLNILNK